ncbi:MAG: sugar ABC transporter permease [Clostridia bacterium]|nr:sugar ABC transporter permease [Clostridia bacterium]
MQLYSLCVIPALLVLVFNYLPIYGLLISFKDYKYSKGIWGSDWVGLDNFKFFIQSNDFTRTTWNTLELNAIFIFFGIVAAVLVAVLLFEIQSRKAVKTYQTILITPHFMSWIIASYMVYAILSPEYGILNRIIEMFGGTAIQWYSIPEVWTWILLLCSLWKHVGMDMVVYYAALMGIDSSLFEAAKIDGANKIQIAWYITIPTLVPLITMLSILKVGGIFRSDFGLFYQVPRDIGALYPRTDTIDTYVYRVMREIGDFSMSTAIGFLQSLVGFCMVMLTNFIARKIDPSRALF